MNRLQATTWMAAAGLLAAAPARAADGWARHRTRCMQAFESYEVVPLRELADCTALWETYRTVRSIKAAERHVAVQAFNFLFEHGSPEEAYLAEQALTRLDEAPKHKRPAGGQRREGPAAGASGATGEAAEPEAPAPAGRARYDPRPVSDKDTRRARALNAKGDKRYKKGDLDGALRQFDRAIEADPRYAVAIYNAARVHARQGRVDMAVEYLQKLRDLGSDDARARLGRARSDEALEACRDRQAFKELTGYAKIKLLNGKGRYGEEEVERLEAYFEKAGYTVDELGVDPHDRAQPIIWYGGRAAKNTAYILTRLVNHPRTLLVPIDWDTDYDIIVSWGDTLRTDPGTNQPYPVKHELKDPEKAAEQARKEQDEALDKPDEYADKADEYASKPANVVDDVHGSVKRVGDTVDKVKDTGDTIKSLGGLGK